MRIDILCNTNRAVDRARNIQRIWQRLKDQRQRILASTRMDRFFVCLLSPSSLFFSLPCFSLVVDSVILLFRLGATPPPRSLRASIMRIPLACCLLSSFFFVALLMLTYLFFFLLFLPIFDFDLDIVCFHPVFFLWVLCCLLGLGFCCDSFSI